MRRLLAALLLVAGIAATAHAGRVTFPYNPTYFLFTTTDQLPDSSNQVGLRFQTSFAVDMPKGPLAKLPGINKGTFRIAYTITTSLDAFAESSPIYNTDQSPEVFWEWVSSDSMPLVKNVKAGWLHLSNGQSAEDSRSVDRFAVPVYVSLDRWVQGLTVWARPWYTMATGDNTHGWHETVNFDIAGNDQFGADFGASLENEYGTVAAVGGKDWVSGFLAVPISDGGWGLLLRAHSGICDTILDYAQRDNAVGAGVVLAPK